MTTITKKHHRRVVMPAHCTACPIRAVTVCQAFLPDRLDSAARLKAGDRVLRQGAALNFDRDGNAGPFHLLDGWLVLRDYDEQGQQCLLDYFLPGTFFENDFVGASDSTARVEALTTVSLCLFKRSEYERAIDDDRGLARAVARSLTSGQARAYQRLRQVQTAGARCRVAAFLLDVWDRVSEEAPQYREGFTIWCPLTQQDIAQATSMTAVYVNRHMRDLRAAGLIDYKEQRLTFLNTGGIRRIASGEIDC